ncbi:FecR family protein [Ramlibacter albus]|uniref:FecR domain-containing protein n=1 Tax=Ramlibacter albus TaxID=2079448 RepID=A0A923M8L6_9BURK|nr:FecR family protein [Ramlibacter albus]MBC5764744.1 FecR domain-containing protein [Ramlibacter albus]
MNFPTFFGRAALAVAVAAAGVPALAQQAAATIVGEATMVIGVARLTGADGSSRGVERGTPIRVGDKVETEVGGHVHFRFIDGGRLSIRPSSRLQVESYNNGGQPAQQTAIKFRLEEGVVRSITGQWGENARDRFRLNTPVAAIGVKGTDFVVRNEGDKTSASVYTGTISVSPLVAGCMGTLGPCQSGQEKLLSEDMKGQMLELSRQQTTPQLVPLVDLMAQQRRMNAGEAQAGKMEKPITVAAAGREEPSADKAVVNESRSAVVVASGNAVAPAVPLPAPQVNQLVWGRWEWVKPVDGDTISRVFEEATQNGRVSTVGDGAYGLFRQAASENALLQTTDTSANFRLHSGVGQLAYQQGRDTLLDPVKVDSGTLNVDFTKQTFATQLNVSGTRIGNESVTAAGIVRPNGYLLGQSGNAYVAGALSVDGKEAGYFFQRSLPAGALSGITLWGR